MRTEACHIALVVGGGSGMGAAISSELAHRGLQVFVADINIDHAHLVAQKIADSGGTAQALQVDVSSSADLGGLFSKLREISDRLDVLVNAAGILGKTAFVEDMSDEQWKRVMSVNLDGTFYCCREAVRWMKEVQSGRIINFSSVAGITPTPGALHYSASKAAIIQLTKTLAKEVARYNIRVNAIAPGYIETPMLEKIDPSFRERILKMTPIKRFGTVDEVASLVGFLVSKEADFFTGQILSPNGGLVI